jgi:hypothetical protein
VCHQTICGRDCFIQIVASIVHSIRAVRSLGAVDCIVVKYADVAQSYQFAARVQAKIQILSPTHIVPTKMISKKTQGYLFSFGSGSRGKKATSKRVEQAAKEAETQHAENSTLQYEFDDYILSHYNGADSGNRDLGPEISLPRDTPFDIVKARAITMRAMLIVLTSPWGGKPGAWYIKGYKAKVGYAQVIEKIESNRAEHTFPRRNCWAIKYRSR